MTALAEAPADAEPPRSGEFVSFPDSPFQLFQPFAPAGDQPAAIAQLVEGIEDGLAYQTLLGVTGSGKTFTMANVIARMGRPAIVFAPNKTLAAQLYSEFREFFPKNAVEYFVSYYDYYQPEAYVPQRDLFIEKDSAINEHIEQMRLSATKSLLERRDVIIVASVSAIYGIGNPADYHKMVMTLRVGDKLSQRDVIAQLIRMQYKRNEIDFARGTFRVRGDTIDVFPAEHSELALRIELFDDEVESLQLLDPLTGRVRQKIPRFTVYPSSHYVTPRERVVRRHRHHQGRVAHAPGRVREERQAGRGAAPGAAHPLRPGDAAGGGPLQGHRELHPPPLSGAEPGEPPPTLVDYLPSDALMFLDESHVLIGQFGGMYNGDRARKTTLVEYGFRLPSALDNRPLKFEEFETQDAPGGLRLGHAGELRAGACRARWSSSSCGPPAWSTPRSRCARPRTQVDDVLQEIRIRVDKARARADHHADQAHGRAADRLPARQRRQGALPAQRHRHGRARGDPARPAPGHLRRAGGHQPAARGPGPARGQPGGHPGRRQGGLPALRAQPDPDHRPRRAQPERPRHPVCRQDDRLA